MKPLYFFILILLCSSCANGNIKNLSCKRGNYKAKKYRVKKIHAYQKTTGYGSSSSPAPSQSAAVKPDPVAVQEPPVPEPAVVEETPARRQTARIQTSNDDFEILEEVPFDLSETVEASEPTVDPFQGETVEIAEVIDPIEEPVLEEETNEPSIDTVVEENSPVEPVQTPDPFDDTELFEETYIEQPNQNVDQIETVIPQTEIVLEDKPDLILNFRDEVINVSEGYSFNEIIPFVINKDQLLNPDDAFQKITDLSKLLKENPQVQVTIIANTATDEPHPSHTYGDDFDTLTQWEQETDNLTLDGNVFTLKNLMVARGKRIEELLVENEVNPGQLSYQYGRHNMWKYQRYVTFVLNEEE